MMKLTSSRYRTAAIVMSAALFLNQNVRAETSPASSAGVDSRTRDLLIQKLTQVHLNLAPSDPSRAGVTLRLADLLAERARLKAMEEIANNCTVCTAADPDRQAALKLYLEAREKTAPDARGKVQAQIGHLYELLGRETDAVATYEAIIADANSRPGARAEAHLSLGEVYFKRRDWARAGTQYRAVLAIPQAASKGLAAYRQAWCRFNSGELETAIADLKTILKTPELLTRSGAPGVVSVDRQFHEEVSRDLATFLARRAVTVADANEVFSLSPETVRLANVVYLATELERVGQVAQAVAIWRYAQERQSDPKARLEGLVRLAQLEMQLGQRQTSVREFENALSLWTTMSGCRDAGCAELQLRLRKFLLDWNRAEKKTPTSELLAAYERYNAIFGDSEPDMIVWAAQVATALKSFDRALALYSDASQRLRARATSQPKAAATEAAKETAKEAAKDATKEATKEAGDARQLLEAALLGAVEAAEVSKAPAHLEAAYALYLERSLERKKALEVQYQKAHLIYERGDHMNAADALRAVAFSAEVGAAEVKLQAADLALDSLVLAKDDAKLEGWAMEFAKAFPSRRSEFELLARKAMMNQAVGLATSGSQSGAESVASLESAWAALARFPVASASSDEQVAYHKNRLVLAEKLRRFPEARDSAERLLKLTGLSEVDRQYALSRQAWLAEMVLDFDSALVATEKMAPAQFASSQQKWLKLAMYADLAARDPRPYYEKYLKDSTEAANRQLIAARLVRESQTPVKELERQRSILSNGDHELLARVSLETYARTSDLSVLKKLLALPVLQKNPGPSAKASARIILLSELEPLVARFESSRIDSANQKKLATSLKDRMALLSQLERLAERAITLQDWTAQLVTLDRLAKESERFYTEILQLPVPAGLSPEDEQQYLALLTQQASPHQLRARDVGQKVGEFWAGADEALAKLRESFAAETGPLRQILAKELAALESVAPAARKAEIANLRASPEIAPERPARESLADARRRVQEAPLERSALERLLVLEQASGRESMVAYLKTRIAALDAPLGAQDVESSVPAPGAALKDGSRDDTSTEKNKDGRNGRK